jgi:hypothetical protein
MLGFGESRSMAIVQAPIIRVVPSVMAIAISSALRDAQHPLHASNDATCYSTGCSTDDRADRAGCISSYRCALSGAPPNALGLSDDRHDHHGKDSSELQNSHCHDNFPFKIAIIILAPVGKRSGSKRH